MLYFARDPEGKKFPICWQLSIVYLGFTTSRYIVPHHSAVTKTGSGCSQAAESLGAGSGGGAGQLHRAPPSRTCLTVIL